MTSTTSCLSVSAPVMRARAWPARPLATAAAIPAVLLALGHSAKAQYINAYFPTGVPGYGTSQGVTVLSRERPLYTAQGVNVGDFTVRPRLDEAFGFDSNPNGISGGGSSLLLRTSPSLSVSSDWSRNALGLSITADNYEYFDKPQSDYTNWTASIGGGYTIGRNNLTLGYSHLSLNQNATDIGAVQSQTPVHFTVDDVRTGYTFDLGRFSVSPSIDAQYYNFDNAIIASGTGTESVSQAYRNRVVLTGGVTTRYSLSDQRSLLFVVEGVGSDFTDQVAGQPSNDSTSALALGGIDYQAEGPWRYQLLVGIEERSFAASVYKTHVAPIVAADAIWTPTELTTLTGSIVRSIESPSAEDSSGFTYTNANLVVDHELYRNILLQGRGGFEVAQYLQGGGSQTGYTLGASVNWLVNRNLRLSVDYNFSQQTSSQVTTFNGVPNATSTNSSASSRDVALLGLHLAM